MAKVLGIGGIFFKTADPKGLRDWYHRVLGFDVQSWGGVIFPAQPDGKTVWSPFAADTTYFAPSTGPFMINLVVDDLDGVLAKAAQENVHALETNDHDPSGRFAWLIDPAGSKIELWEPKPKA